MEGFFEVSGSPILGPRGELGRSSMTAVGETTKFVRELPREESSPPGLPSCNSLTATTSGVRSALLKRSSGKRNAPVLAKGHRGHSLRKLIDTDASVDYYRFSILSTLGCGCQTYCNHLTFRYAETLPLRTIPCQGISPLVPLTLLERFDNGLMGWFVPDEVTALVRSWGGVGYSD